MPALRLARQTHPGRSPRRDAVVCEPEPDDGRLPGPAWIVLACQCSDPDGFSVRARPLLRAESQPAAILDVLAPEACLALVIQNDTLLAQARHAVRAQRAAPLQFLRLADATVQPLPPEPEPFTLQPGDTYLALSPGALALADSPAIARFIHLRDYFNAEKMAGALLEHLLESGAPPEDVTLLVIESR
jgi:hypothetical protein